jgi:hypothetical protein
VAAAEQSAGALWLRRERTHAEAARCPALPAEVRQAHRLRGEQAVAEMEQRNAEERARVQAWIAQGPPLR